MLTKEKLLARMEELQNQRDAFIANANMCSGAMQECQRILREEFNEPSEQDGGE
jgi:hypothetical protein